MIQDIGPHRFHVTFRDRPPGGQDSLLIYKDDHALMMREGDALCFPRVGDLPLPDDTAYLFSLDDHAFFGSLQIPDTLPDHCVWMPTGEFRTYQPNHLAFAGITGRHLHHWYDRHRFCGRCAQPMRPVGHERALRCTGCGHISYPKISPAVIVAITDGDRLLLSRYAGRSYSNYALIAGFMEVGETLEDTVRREVMEEVGLRVHNLRYYRSQPWAFSDSLLVGFFCDLDGDPTITLDETELAEAVWVHRRDVPSGGTPISLTRTMIDAFVADSYPK